MLQQLITSIRELKWSNAALELVVALRRAQVDWDVVSPVEIIQLRNEVTEEAEILAAANRLATNMQFIAWLPIAQSMQLDHIRINGDRKNKATNLLNILRASLGH